jgi:arginase
MTTTVFTYSSGIAGRDLRCKNGPKTIKNSPLLINKSLPLDWSADLIPETQLQGEQALPEVVRLNQQLAQLTRQATLKNLPFITLAGEHSSAIGTWSGVASATQEQNQTLGLIWIDAHMDSHTMETSDSKNIHGMPLAALLGHGHPALTNIASDKAKLQPEHVFLIGCRSYEPAEENLLKQLGVRVYLMPEIKDRGLVDIFNEVLNQLATQTDVFGISIDLDAIDPQDAPAISTPACDGIQADKFLKALPILTQSPKLLGSELVEFLPEKDIDQQSEKLMINIFSLLATQQRAKKTKMDY